jgi:TolB-like protein
MKLYKYHGGVLVLGILLVACAGSPTVQIQTTRTPTMNTSGIRRIAIEPFTTSDNSAIQRRLAAIITAEVTRRLQETGYFTLVDYSEVQRLQRSNASIENHVDAVFVGQVISLKVEDSSRLEEQHDPATKQTKQIRYYSRRAELSFSFNFKRARDGSLVGVVIKRGSSQDGGKTERSALKSEDQLLQEIVTSHLADLAHAVTPWKEIKTYKLMDAGKRADKILKAQMKAAYELVREGSYRQALNEYEAIYAETGNFGAGYNVTLLYEALGDIEEARRLARELVDSTGNPTARTRLAQIDQVIADIETVESVYSDQRSQFEKVMETVIPLIAENLPKQRTVFVQNVSRTNRELADRATDTIIYALQEAGIKLVDRNSAAMLRMEREYQGQNWDEFDDSTIAGFGQEAGVQIFALVSITGASDSRRLQVRILDVARGVVIYQTPQSSEMKL